MTKGKEGLYTQVISKFSSDQLDFDNNLSTAGKNFLFAMHCNGYYFGKDKGWRFNKEAVKPFAQEFEGQRVAFFGPSPSDRFYSTNAPDFQILLTVLKQQTVLEAIGRYHQTDEDLAARLAFIFGGIIRQKSTTSGMDDLEQITRAVGFAAKLTMLGEAKSAQSLASAAAMYVLSGGPLDEDRNFIRDVYAMSDAIAHDPIKVTETQDLGLSQVARLRNYQNMRNGQWYQPFPSIEEDLEALRHFPTVGAEFHLTLDSAAADPLLWKKLALLNMSQYQPGSYIQLSRPDREVIEIRMNPSVYPVTVANWHQMRGILGQLEGAPFTSTINRRDQKDFSWSNDNDQKLLYSLRSMGMVTYAGLNENIPTRGQKGEIKFGGIYLGQTVRAGRDGYFFSGLWGGSEGQCGQLGVYAGSGINLPYLSYYLSMALAKPDILRGTAGNMLSGVRTLSDALKLSSAARRYIFNSIDERITADWRLDKARTAGQNIVDALTF